MPDPYQLLLQEKLKNLGRVRAYHPTPESIEKCITAFNKEHNTNFEIDN